MTDHERDPGPIARQARDAVRRHVLEPLLPRCIDDEYGGFLVDFDERWRPIGPHEKSLEHAARTTIAFALLDRVMPGEGCDRAVRHGCAFLQQAMWDDRHGGFFARVERSGRPLWNGLKHPHAVTYAVRAFRLADSHLPPGEGAAWAARARAWLDDVAWDTTHGGYWGSYRRDHQRYAEGMRLPTADGRDIFGLPPGVKEINTQGDAIEMLSEIVERGGDERAADRLAALTDLIADRLVDAHGVLPYVYRPDWRLVPDLVRVGYQFMLARHLIAVPASPARRVQLLTHGRRLVDFCLTHTRHPEGGFCLAVPAHGRSWPATGPATELRQWWVQIEAVHTLHVLAQQSGLAPEARERYLAERDAQWAFVRRTFFDERYGGLRELPLDRRRRWRGAPPARKSHPWKDVSHEVGTLLALAAEVEPSAREPQPT